MVPYVVSAVTVMHVLLFVLYVCVLQECEGARATASCGSSQCCVLHDLQFGNAVR